MSMHKTLHIVETASVMTAGLGMMMLIIVGAWLGGVYVMDSRQVASTFIGNAPGMSISSDDVATLQGQFAETGKVAGLVDDSNQSEDSLRNSAAKWLNEARYKSGLGAMYRDSILDRRAQNHARTLADSCDVDTFNDWSDAIGTQIDEGTIRAFSESAFLLQDDNFIDTLPQNQPSYERLFTLSNAYGIGVAAIPQTASDCAGSYVLTVHMAEIL